MQDAAAVKRAMYGCDAVFHAAAAVSLDPNKAQETYDNNLGCVKAVIGSACDLGIQRMVHVSSLSVLFHPGLSEINEEMPLADCKDAYSRSKRDSDRYVRDLQQRGCPVQIVYPSAIVGPDDPKLSEANHALMRFVTEFLPLTTSGFQTVDVRDLALANLFLLENSPKEHLEDARYIIGGHYYPWNEFHRALQVAAGRRIFAMKVAPGLLRAVGRSFDALNRLVPFETQISAEAMSFVTQWSPASSARFERLANFRFRSGEETFRDTLKWLASAQHIDRTWAAAA
jgi:nucleoside-diphosphate-sugar epimerase